MTSFFDTKKSELEQLYTLVKNGKSELIEISKNESENIKKSIEYWEKLKIGVLEMAKERQKGFPWLAKAYEELFLMQDKALEIFLANKKNPAVSTSDKFKEQSKLRRQAEKEKKIAQSLVEYYEYICPFLVELKEEEVLEFSQVEIANYEKYSDEEKADETSKYLSIEEFRKLPSYKRNQIALDRYNKRPKPKWLIGKNYERYIGYLYEEEGYEVEYHGIIKGFEDLGRDLICKKGNQIIIIQCKNWSQFKTIYEKHIFQFFGTFFQFRDENKGSKVEAIFYTSTKLSDFARKFAKELKIDLKENFKYTDDYPCIKCNISKATREKIYHLPFDQQYDTVKIERKKGEFYCKTVKEAEDAGFRRAFKFSQMPTK